MTGNYCPTTPKKASKVGVQQKVRKSPSKPLQPHGPTKPTTAPIHGA